jgi:hypothetical protein
MKIEVNVPESLDDITLEQYQRFTRIEEPTEEQTLTTFLDITLEELRMLPADFTDDFAGQIESIFKQDKEFTSTFILNGVRYGFIPKLDDITYGENKDLTTYLNSFDNMHKAMAVMYRPVTHFQKGKYLIESYEGSAKYSEVMKQAPLSVVLGATVFFWNLTTELAKTIPNYLAKELTETQEDLLKSGEVTVKQLLLLRTKFKELSEYL